ncbi:MAG: helix-hairpin-helix domain-containing protein [Bacteroidales bacterium]|nr:helix-hairpin-helix domain-containing protein [Bacteroidales bacterium]
MKNKLNFTGGEWVAALVLLALILASYLFYYLYDANKEPSVPMAMYAREFEVFVAEQARLADSAERAHAQNYSNYKSYRSVYDTSKGRKQSREPLYAVEKINLNRCDSTDLLVVPQFGSKRVARLVEYRDRLGGFYSLSQLKEVYVLQNLDDNLLEKYFVVHPSEVRKLNINTATYKELVSHPYFDVYLTKTILNYRQRQGRIESFEQLQQITHAYPELMEKLRHYVEF